MTSSYELPLTRNKTTLLDLDIYNTVIKGTKWCCSAGNYAIRKYNNKTQYLHVFIMNPPEGFVVDHINGNTLDNRLCNLRICTKIENSRNRKPNIIKKLKAKGVDMDKRTGKFRARIRVNYKHIYLGTFQKEEDAAKAYNEAAIKYHGTFSKTNEEA